MPTTTMVGRLSVASPWASNLEDMLIQNLGSGFAAPLFHAGNSCRKKFKLNQGCFYN